MEEVNYPKPEDVFSRLSRERQDEMRDFITKASFAIQNHPAAKQLTQFPEVYFVQHFLPFFCGEVPANDIINEGRWADIARGQYNRVEIVDLEGKVLYTVPPLMVTDIINPVLEEQAGIGSVMRHARKLEEVSAATADRFMQSSIIELHMRKTATPQMLENTRIWNDIFKRYGKVTQELLKTGDTPASSTSTPAPPPEDEMGYEFED